MKHILHIIISMFCLSMAVEAQSQVMNIPWEIKYKQVEDKYEHANYEKFCNVLKNTDAFNGIPLIAQQYKIFEVIADPMQSQYEKDELFFRNHPKVLPSEVTLNFIGKNKFHIYVGIDFNKKMKYIVVDSNNNDDFSDDEMLAFQINVPSRKKGFWTPISANVSMFDGSQCVPHEYKLIMFPKADVNDSLLSITDKSCFDITVSTAHYRIGHMKIGNDNLYVYPGSDDAYPMRFKKGLIRFIRMSDYSSSIMYVLGDTLLLNDRKLHIADINADMITIEDLGACVDSSKVGSYLPELVSRSLADIGQNIVLNPLWKDKYVFLDFWGSWCGPCVASLPKLKTMYDKIKHRDDVLVVGIALDRATDLDKLRGIIKDQGIEWLNVWNDWTTKRSPLSPSGKLNIQGYPTYIIVDKSGKIVFTTNDPSCKREDAISFFMDLIK